MVDDTPTRCLPVGLLAIQSPRACDSNRQSSAACGETQPTGHQPVTCTVEGLIGATGAVGVVVLGAVVDVVVVGTVQPAATVMLSSCVAITCGELESATCTVKGKVPAVVGVPLITPDDESVKPGGNFPTETTDQAYGGVPLVAARVVDG